MTHYRDIVEIQQFFQQDGIRTNAANELLQEGWVLISAACSPSHDSETNSGTTYVMGRPRPTSAPVSENGPRP